MTEPTPTREDRAVTRRVRGLQRNRRIPSTFVEIERDGIEGTARVHPDSLEIWRARGWREVQPAADQTGEQPAGGEQAAPTAADTTAAAAEDTAARRTATRRAAPTGQES